MHFGGTPLKFFEQARAGLFRLAMSAPIRIEVWRVLHEKFAWPDGEIADALLGLDECTTLVQPLQRLTVIADDPADDRILERAVAAASAFIVSGDNHLLRLGSYGGIQIVRVAEFLRSLPGKT